MTPGEPLPAPPTFADARQGFPLSASGPAPGVFVFNPFAEGYLARGAGFTPVKHQALLADDLANLPQFLCRPDDVVLLPKRPAAGFLDTLRQAGFPPPEFIELGVGQPDPTRQLGQRKPGHLRPWAWGPDSLKLLAPLLPRMADGPHLPGRYFNDDLARLYSKAWSADFLRQVLVSGCAGNTTPPPGTAAENPWLCSVQEAGTAVDTLADALAAIAAIRDRGHHRVVVKTAYGLAGHNAIRLWEPELLPAQRQWLIHALSHGQPLVVEPWLERVLDFSIQLEMGPRHLALFGYTGLINDRKGQFLANWADADCTRNLPAAVAALFPLLPGISERIHRLYREVFSRLAGELQRVGFVGPISIDAFVYRTPRGDCRLKPVVEINPRHTMGRLTLELMQHARPGTCGLFQLVNTAQLRAEGCADLSAYARALAMRLPLCVESKSHSANHPPMLIRQGALCLNDPAQARVCLATFEVSPALTLPASLGGPQLRPSP